MTLPLSSPFADNTLVNKAQLDQVVTALNTSAFGIESETVTGSTITLSTTSRFAAGATATFVLTATSRIKITTSAQYVPATTTSGRCTVQSGYNTGSSVVIGSFVGVGQAIAVISSSTLGPTGTVAVGTVVLAAGTYIAYPGVTRVSGGSATDTTNTPYVLVEHIGVV